MDLTTSGMQPAGWLTLCQIPYDHCSASMDSVTSLCFTSFTRKLREHIAFDYDWNDTVDLEFMKLSHCDLRQCGYLEATES